jgi:hypothetical protein
MDIIIDTQSFVWFFGNNSHLLVSVSILMKKRLWAIIICWEYIKLCRVQYNQDILLIMQKQLTEYDRLILI